MSNIPSFYINFPSYKIYITPYISLRFGIVDVCRMDNTSSGSPTSGKPLKKWCWKKWSWEAGNGSQGAAASVSSKVSQIPWLDCLVVFCNFRSAFEVFGLSASQVLVVRTALCMGLPELLACNGRDFDKEVNVLYVLEPFLRKNRRAAACREGDTPVGRIMGKQWPHISPTCPATRMRILWECVWDCSIDSLACLRRDYLAVCGGYAAARVHRGSCGLLARLAVYGDVDVFCFTSSSCEFGRISALPRSTSSLPAMLDWASVHELVQLCEHFPQLGERSVEMQLLRHIIGLPAPPMVTRYGVDTSFVVSGDPTSEEDGLPAGPQFRTVTELRRTLDPAIDNGHQWELDIIANQGVHDMLLQCSDVWEDTNANHGFSQTCRSRAVYRFAAVQDNTAGRCGVVDLIMCINPTVLTAGDVVHNFDMAHVSVYLSPLQAALTAAELLSRPFWARGPEGTFFGGHDDQCLVHARWGLMTLRPRGVCFLQQDYPFGSWQSSALSSFILVNWPRIRKYLARGWEIRTLHGHSEDHAGHSGGAFHDEVWKPSDSLPQYDSKTRVCLMAPRLSGCDSDVVTIVAVHITAPVVWQDALR